MVVDVVALVVAGVVTIVWDGRGWWWLALPPFVMVVVVVVRQRRWQGGEGGGGSLTQGKYVVSKT